MRFPDILQFAPIESRRFNLRAYRGLLESIDTDQLLSAIIEKEIDLVILRIPAQKQHTLFLLNDMGVPFIITDTLVYYHADMQTAKPKPCRNNDLQFTKFTPEYFDVMDHMVQAIFAGYHNNYSANPMLEADLIDIYQEWAKSFATDASKGKVSWIVGRGNEYFGLITCLVEENGLEVILNGVMPHKAGQGIYGDMIRFVQRYCIENRLSRITISTQVNNYAVQKVWGREGFHLKQAFLTVHINSLMQASRLVKKTFDFRISREDVAQLTAGMACLKEGNKSIPNTVEGAGENFLYHLLPAGYHRELTPADKAVIKKTAVRYLKPLQVEEHYRIEISYPYMNPEKKTYTSLLKLFDDSGGLCLFAFFDFVNMEKAGAGFYYENPTADIQKMLSEK